MAILYDGNGKPIQVSGGASSDFGVADYALFKDDAGNTARQAVLTYQGKKLYPKNYPEQRLDFVKDYGGGVMFALGDSYTAMGASYFSAFAEKHGLVCDNRGLASSTIAGDEAGNVGYMPFWSRLDAAIVEYQAGHTINGTTYTKEDVKLVIFMGGANDWFTVDETQGIDRLGNPKSEDKAQLYGACKYIFATLLANFPNADIVVILQPSNLARIFGHWQKESIVREMAELYGLPICDCCFEWYNPQNADDLATYWQTDKLHMTDAGNTAIFDKLEKVVNNLPFTRNK
jgi:lysophospholipase L1-like esterase